MGKGETHAYIYLASHNSKKGRKEGRKEGRIAIKALDNKNSYDKT